MITQLDKPYRTILTLSLPMAATQVITMSSGFLCMTMLATLGKDVLAACALIVSTQMAVMLVGMSSLFSLCILIGHAYGDRDYDRVGLLLQQGWTMAVIISVPIMFLLWHIGSILIYFGQLKHIAYIVQEYFYAHTWRVLPLLLAVANQQLCYGVRKQKIDIAANILGVFVLVGAANILIFGKLGFPALGVRGYAYAITMQSTFYFVFTSICFFCMNDFKMFRLFQYRLHLHWQKIVDVLKFSWPITLQISGEMLSMFATAAMMGWIGVQALSAHQVVTQYMLILLVPIFALSQATAVIVGQACGAKQFDHVKVLGNASLHIAIIISFIIAAIFIIFPAALSSMYIDVNDPVNATTLALIKVLFMAGAASMFFDTIRNIVTGALRGTFDTRFPMIVGLVMIWLVGIPLSYMLAFTFNWGAVGIPLGTVVGMLIGAMILLFRWRNTAPAAKYSSPSTLEKVS